MRYNSTGLLFINREVIHITVLSYTGLHSSFITLSLLALFKLNERFNLVVTTEADTYHNTKGGWVGGLHEELELKCGEGEEW